MIKSQITNSKLQTNHNTKITIPKLTSWFVISVIRYLVLFVICVLYIGIFTTYAQDSAKVAALKQQTMQAKTTQDLYTAFEETADLYFNANKYAEFVSFLDSLSKEKKDLAPLADYFIALCRYYQLKYLEGTQNWDEYFAQGNTYRDQIVASAQKTIDATSAKEAPNLYARLVLWKFHQDQQDNFSAQALEDLMQGASEYAQEPVDLGPLKAVADELSAYGEKGKSRQLYQLYARKIINLDVPAENLKNIAADFYGEGNAELAELLYDAYIERISKDFPQGKITPILTDIARQFSALDAKGADPLYAEKIFKKIEEAGGEGNFNQELMYLRARNLEKAKLYAEAKGIYLDLLNRFPDSPRLGEINFRIGVIYTYILRDAKNGRLYFAKAADSGALSPQSISALYQLGLLKQWEGDNAGAKNYYDLLLAKAGRGYAQTVQLAQERLAEINAARPLDYNLKSFLDACLKEENAGLDMSKLDLTPVPSSPKINEEVNITATAYTAESGCMPVTIQYLWAGELGAAKPAGAQPSFTTRYAEPGTYLVGLTAVSPSGALDRSIVIIDVQ